MADDSTEDTIAAQNRRKLEEHLNRIKKHGGVPPPQEEKPRPQPRQAQNLGQGERQQFRKDWDAWKRAFGGRVIDLNAQPVQDLTADYKLLGVLPGSNKEEIRKAFYRHAKENHPDTGGDVNKFRALMEAYERLTGSG